MHSKAIVNGTTQVEILVVDTLEACVNVVNLGVVLSAYAEIMLVLFICTLAWISEPDVF